MNNNIRHIILLVCLLLTVTSGRTRADVAQNHQATYERVYDADHPLVIVGDWDKPPYEFQDEKGQPAGINIDVMRAVFDRLGIPCKFMLKEWANAIKTFERGDADIILANAKRYRKAPYVFSRNIINYNRIVAATKGTDVKTYSLKQLVNEGIALKPADYTVYYFLAEDSSYIHHIEFQSPKIALMGVTANDIKYYVWGEEPLKWKIKQLNMEKSGIVLNDVGIPISEIHAIGRDKKLIADFDYVYSQLKQSGRVALINDKWLHPERIHHRTIPMWAYLLLGALVFAGLVYMGNRMVRNRVKDKAQRNSEITDMMTRALQMGHFYVLHYDLQARILTNIHGNLLPEKGMTWYEFNQRFHPAERNDCVRKVEKLKDGNGGTKLELHARWNAGTKERPKWMHLRGHFIVELDEKGVPSSIYNTVVDVTHNVGLIHEAMETEKKYLRFFQVPEIAIAIYDNDGWLIDTNDTMKRVCNYEDPKSERYYQKICLFDMPMFSEAFADNRREPIYICRHLTPSENDLGIDTYVEYNIIPLFDYYGRVISYVVMAVDVKKERNVTYTRIVCRHLCEQLREQINHQEAQLHLTLEKSNAMLWRLDLHKKEVFYARSLRHIDFNDPLEEYLKRVPQEVYDASLPVDERISKFDKPFHITRRYTNTVFNKEEAWHDIYGQLQKDQDGITTGYHGVLLDITRLVKLKNELKDVLENTKNSAQQKSVFLASMTHELRTPLNSIVGFTDLLRYAESPEERTKFVHIIRTHCDILVRLIDGILEASSISDNPMDVKPKEVDFAEEFEFICQSVEPRIHNHHLRFVTSKPLKKLRTSIDIGRIRQVVSNFVGNALKYTTKGYLWLGYRLEKRNDHMGLYVFCEDTGTGIPKEKQQSVFERFVKLNEFVQGTGLGLSICKSIITASNGEIGVDSEVGKGSKFWFWIPIDIIEKE